MKKKIVISVVCSIILMVFFYNYQSFFLFQIDKFILSNTEMIEKYFNIVLNEKIEIIQFDISKSDFMDSYAIAADILIDYNDVEEILSKYIDTNGEVICEYPKDRPEIYPFVNAISGNNWPMELKYELCIQKFSAVTLANGIGSRGLYIFVSEPEDDKSHIYIYQDMLGWKEYQVR